MRGSGARALLPALVVLGLVAVVAIASTGRTAKGTNDVRPPAATLLDTILTLGMVAVIAGAILFLYGLTKRQEIAQEVASGRYRRTTLLGWIAFVAAFTALAYWRLGLWDFTRNQSQAEPDYVPSTGKPLGQQTDTGTNTYEPHIAWIPVGVILGLVALAIAAYVVSERRRRPAVRERDELAADVAAVLDETLEDLRTLTDPRRAVIAAYARLEQVLAAHGLPRRRSETEEEYLARMLEALDVSTDPAVRLTVLFERARFSLHVVDSGMKDEAISALEAVRNELAATAAGGEERSLEPAASS